VKQAGKSQFDRSEVRPAAGRVSHDPDLAESTRPESTVRRKLSDRVGRSPGIVAQRALMTEMHNSPRMATQRKQLRAMYGPAQRVKIRLKDEDEDKVLMDRLRDVQVPSAGGQTLDGTNVDTLHEIGKTENIILEGHGYYDDPLFGTPKVVKQGGIPPSELAALAHRVPKPGDWSGNIILLGCSTGEITTSVSREYYKLKGAAVNVIGTKMNIRVGTDESGGNFVGYD
jgi:hypothetical protein